MNKKAKIFLCTASIVGIVGVSGIFAYLTDTDTASNNNGIPDYAENVVPNAIIEKDPQVKNVGKNDAYVFLKVTVPAKNVITAQENGTLENNGQAQATQLFTYTPNAKWTEIT